MNKTKKNIFMDRQILGRALKDSVKKLNPKAQIQNPVMFLVYVSAILTTVLFVFSLAGVKDTGSGFIFGVAVILWFTDLFGNFAEAIAEGRGKAQADALRASRKDVMASKIPAKELKNEIQKVPSASLRKGDFVLVTAGEQIPADGDVVDLSLIHIY